MQKSRDAFRTIGEVSDYLNTPTYVLRFWEGKFRQIKPVKRLGNRRYYRPFDVRLIGGIKTLLYRDRLTIKAVRALLKEKGTHYVADFFEFPTRDDAKTNLVNNDVENAEIVAMDGATDKDEGRDGAHIKEIASSYGDAISDTDNDTDNEEEQLFLFEYLPKASPAFVAEKRIQSSAYANDADNGQATMNITPKTEADNIRQETLLALKNLRKRVVKTL